MYDKYVSPLSERYASKEMQYIFSPDMKFRTWRRLWIALAETEKELGLDITEEQIEELKAHVTFSVPKFLMTDDGDYLAMVEPKVKAALGKNFSVYRSDPFFLEILPKGIDKAQSLERLLAVIGVKREEMIACGDGYNDLTMVQYAGLGVAMGNGVLPVRKAADYITLTNEEDGVAHVVEKFMLS